MRLNRGRFAGIRVADERYHRIGHASARLAMKRAGALHLDQLALELGDAVVDQPPVHLKLRLAGTAEKAETATLAFEMGPGPYQPAAH